MDGICIGFNINFSLMIIIYVYPILLGVIWFLFLSGYYVVDPIGIGWISFIVMSFADVID